MNQRLENSTIEQIHIQQRSQFANDISQSHFGRIMKTFEILVKLMAPTQKNAVQQHFAWSFWDSQTLCPIHELQLNKIWVHFKNLQWLVAFNFPDFCCFQVKTGHPQHFFFGSKFLPSIGNRSFPDQRRQCFSCGSNA